METIGTIWSNTRYEESETELLREKLRDRGYLLIREGRAEVLFGQPTVGMIIDDPAVRWVHLDSAGYDRYDTDEFRRAAVERGLAVTNSSSVYDEPCAQHAAAMILSLARRLPYALQSQLADNAWPMMQLRKESYLLNGRKVVILGYGAIARKLSGLLRPFGVEISALRRTPVGDEEVEIFTYSELGDRLAAADDVVNILPANNSTRRFVDREMIGRIRPGATFLNIGRGGTVDQEALIDALKSGLIAAAYLDVTDPEPLPSDHPLWSAPNCFITPHTAGGSVDERPRLIDHFLRNLDRYLAGEQLLDRII